MKMTYESFEGSLNNLMKKKSNPSLSKEYQLGKFLFSVSSGTIAFLLAAEKITDGTQWNITLIISLITLVAAAFLSLVVSLPKKQLIKESIDNFDKNSLIASNTIGGTYAWFIVWFIGAGTGAWAVLH